MRATYWSRLPLPDKRDHAKPRGTGRSREGSWRLHNGHHRRQHTDDDHRPACEQGGICTVGRLSSLASVLAARTETEPVRSRDHPVVGTAARPPRAAAAPVPPEDHGTHFAVTPFRVERSSGRAGHRCARSGKFVYGGRNSSGQAALPRSDADDRPHGSQRVVGRILTEDKDSPRQRGGTTGTQTGPDTRASTHAPSVFTPRAIAAQNLTWSSRHAPVRAARRGDLSPISTNLLLPRPIGHSSTSRSRCCDDELDPPWLPLCE